MLRASERASYVPLDGKVVSLVTLDQRSREYRLMQETRADLLAHVGSMPSATQLALIERATQLRLRLAIADQKFADSGIMGDKATSLYLSLTNTYCKVMNLLGLRPPPRPKENLQGYLASRYGGGCVRDVHENGATTPARTPAKANGGNGAGNGVQPAIRGSGVTRGAIPRRTLPP